MKVVYRDSFAKDLSRNQRDKVLMCRVREAISGVEMATAITELVNVKKMKGHAEAYRIRIGDYRMGVYFDGTTVEFVRILHRKDIYKSFP